MNKESKAKRYVVFAVQILSAAVLVLIDQLIKKSVSSNLAGKDDIILIKNFFGLTYAKNTGAAFSMFSNSTFVLSVVTLVILLGAVVVMFLGKVRGKLPNVCAVMIIAGGGGNLIDRFAKGYVVDYIETLFIDFPIFNFADILVTCGVIILCAYLIFDMIRDEKNKKRERENEQSV